MSENYPPPPGPPPGPQDPTPGVPSLPHATPPRRRNPVVAGVIAGIAVLALVAGGIAIWQTSDGDDAAATSDDVPATSGPAEPQPSTDPRLARFYHQKLRWKDCGADQCAHLTVPLDYARPAAETVELAVLRVPAQNKDKRIGSLVVNPGGPGGSGVNYAAAGSLQFGNALSDVYDIVGFDPRGVAASDPLHCLGTAGLDELLASDPDPDDQAERDQYDKLISGFGNGCLDESGDLTRRMSTEEVAQDMDILRAALGESKLDYLGASYGTFIGATYADMFPGHVGRFVLDGAIDPSLSNEQLSLQQAGGFETALRAYVQDCVDQGDCFLGDTVDAGVKKIGAFLQGLDSKPLPTSDSGRPLTEGLGMLGVWMPLYVEQYWPQLTRALQQAFDDGSGTALLQLADTYASRGPDGYVDNSMEALYAVNCLDHDDYIQTKDVPSHFAQFEKVSPTFGRAFSFSLSTCANWPVQSGKHSVALHAKGAPPIVVVGTTRDPATPYAWAQALADQLESGRLITRDGDGHTGFMRGNECVDDAVESWLIQGKAPKDGLMC
ncbi:alpha/beta hydrolase [Marmoricola sp. RAF53]|uniref:alpha/beta hydrolase n=1 Tax=Marmoricola sp. RAF53 TaxID=3233059 RepID=UPI003F94DA77